jgi:hypothetical protein
MLIKRPFSKFISPFFGDGGHWEFLGAGVGWGGKLVTRFFLPLLF